MRIKLATPLIGEFPRYANVKLPDNAAVTAQNMRLDSGVLKPLNGYTTGATLALTGHNINSIHLWKVGGDAYWLRFADNVNVIRSPIADDSYSRIYWRNKFNLLVFKVFYFAVFSLIIFCKIVKNQQLFSVVL